MFERMKQYLEKLIQLWNRTSTTQRIVAITLIIALILGLAVLIPAVTKPDYVQLYANLSEKETGEIAARLQERGIPYQLTDDGRGIMVPKEMASQIKVDLAAEGIPQSGSITYESIAENMGLGYTDKQFSVIERDAMQNELRQMMIQGIKGIRDAQVMITLPQETIWVNQEPGEATASIILDIDPAYRISQAQINALYTLVSKSIPNLPVENIIITNQYGEELTPDFSQSQGGVANGDFERMQEIKHSVEKDIQRGIQQLLGTILGPQNVVVQVFATLDFAKETRQEQLVEAPNAEDQQGLIISMEKLRETYDAQGANSGGVVGPGETDVPGYQAAEENGGNSNYEKSSDKINYEVNRITRNIVMSPYRIKDLSISVGVQLPENGDPQANQQILDGIRQVVKNVVRTSLSSQDLPELDDQALENRIMVLATNFNAPSGEEQKALSGTMILLYILGGIVLLGAAGAVYWLIRRRRRESAEEELAPSSITQILDEMEEETEESLMRKRLEHLAKEKPQEFATLLRTWLAEE